MNLSNITKQLSLMLLLMPLICEAARITEMCPTVDQLRTGLGSEWKINVSKDNLDNLSFKNAQITFSSFTCQPFIRCVYQRENGRQVLAEKDDSMHTPYVMNGNLWIAVYDNNNYSHHYECAASLESCSWDNEDGCHGAPHFPM